MKLLKLSSKISSQTDQNSPAWNKKATAHKALLDGSIEEKQVKHVLKLKIH